jgi:hypothetical protein
MPISAGSIGSDMDGFEPVPAGNSFPTPRQTLPATRQVRSAASGTVALNFKVPREFRRHLKMLAAERGVSMTALLERALECLVNCETHGHARHSGTERPDMTSLP